MKLVVMLDKLAAWRAAHARGRMARLGARLQDGQRFRLGFADGLLDQQTNLFVSRLWADDPMPFQHSARIGVDHKYRMVPSVKQDRVSRLRSNAVQRQQLRPELFRRTGEHAIKRSAILLVQKSKKRFDLSRFLAKVSRGPNQLL